MFHKRCFVYLCYDFPIIDILCFTSFVLYICVMISLFCILCLTSVVLYICVLLSLLLVFYVSQALFCISVLWFPYNWYFMFYKRCFVYLCSAFPIIGILCITSFVLYIFVMISLLLVFYVSQALFCISVLWFSHNWYFMFHKCCFVYLCYDFPIIGILCFTRVVLYICVLLSLLLVFYVSQALFCISVLWIPYN